jgi:hypothetical protein
MECHSRSPIEETLMRRDGPGWLPPPLPDDPAERRKIGVRLLILAALAVIAQIISTIAAW